MAGYADALASVLYPNSAANSMYTLGGQGLAQVQLPTFSNPWANMLAQGAQQLAGGALQAYGVKAANEANLANAAAMIPQLPTMGIQISDGVAQGLASPDPKVRQIALALTESSMKNADAQKASELDFQKYAKQRVFDGIINPDPRARQAALEAAGGIGLIRPESAQNVSAIKKTPFDRALEIEGDPESARALVQKERKMVDDYQDELVRVQSAHDFVIKQFEDSKNLSSIGAAIPTTKTNSELAGIKTNIKTHLQKMLGREMNNGEQQRLDAALPTWTDSAEQIERKRSRYMELINQLVPQPRVPRLTVLGGQQEQPAASAETAPKVPIGLSAALPTGTPVPAPDAGAPAPANITQEQAREILKARGVAGY